MSKHKIDWLNLPGYKGETWNPVVGCTKISEGCKNCYAEKMARRLAGIEKLKKKYQTVISNSRWNGQTSFDYAELAKPETWKKPRVVFVCSMGDLFHETVSFTALDAIFTAMSDNDKHIFIVLTKRPERMKEFFEFKCALHYTEWKPSKNIWLGVTVENQEQANNRIPILLKLSAAVRFVSIEPMLGAIDLEDIVYEDNGECHINSLYCDISIEDDETFNGNTLDWVIVGGESGHKARPMHPEWVQSIRDQCKEAGVPFFFKQNGEWIQVGECGNCDHSKYYYHPKCQILNIEGRQGYYGEQAVYMMKVGRNEAGDLLDGKTHKEFPKAIKEMEGASNGN